MTEECRTQWEAKLSKNMSFASESTLNGQTTVEKATLSWASSAQDSVGVHMMTHGKVSVSSYAQFESC